jgi:hypothetical protein
LSSQALRATSRFLVALHDAYEVHRDGAIVSGVAISRRT